jgi:S1-C subfamily serine protease
MAAVGATGAAAQERAPAPSSTAERVYAEARAQLLQVRTLLVATGRQASNGSGFMVTADGLALTNYHVVSQYALEPATYRLEYTAADGTQGKLTLLAIDLANDLAVVRLDRNDPRFLRFDERAVNGGLFQGERLYSMGNPLDLGFSIVEGTYNGGVERSYSDRILFSGAINPGMSGGPTVTADGRVAGINVSKRRDGDLVSFLVPARFGAALVERARARGTSPGDFNAEIGRQLTEWQQGLYTTLDRLGFRTATFGPYVAPESVAPWFSCWARTNAGQAPKPHALVDATTCDSDTRLHVANDLNVGMVKLTHAYARSISLNQFQFAAFLSRQNQVGWAGAWSTKWHTRQRCHEEFLRVAETGEHPPIRTVWCARANRKFDDLYDVWVTVVTQDRGTEALVSQLALQSISYDNAIMLTQRFLGEFRWAK